VWRKRQLNGFLSDRYLKEMLKIFTIIETLKNLVNES